MGACLDITPLDSATHVDESAPESKDEPSPREKGVLLLGEDSCFNETLKSFLTKSGYRVTTARNGVEGLRTALASDFAVILCEMMMPRLSGEMFHRALKSVRPNLCKRFIFMTTDRGDQRTNDFIKGANAQLLMKPFSMDALMETLSRVELSSGPGEAARIRPRIVRPVSVPSVAAPQPKSRIQPVQTPRPPPAAATANVRKAVSPAPAAIPIRRTANGFSSAERERREGERFSTGLISAAVGICVLLGAIVHLWSSSLRDRIASSMRDLQALETDWMTASAQLQEAERMRPRIETLVNLPKRIAEGRQVAGWAPLLEALATSAGPETLLQEIHAHGMPADPGACELRIDGFSTGLSAPATADRFRQALQTRLESQFRGPVTVRFDKLENHSELAPGLPQQKAIFTITAIVGKQSP